MTEVRTRAGHQTALPMIESCHWTSLMEVRLGHQTDHLEVGSGQMTGPVWQTSAVGSNKWVTLSQVVGVTGSL